MKTNTSADLAPSEATSPRPARRNGLLMKQRILQAAQSIIFEEGTDALTIDRVIAKAGISKGAFVYHYPTRQALIEALMDSYVAHIDDVQTEYEMMARQVKNEVSPYIESYANWYRDFSAGLCDSGQSILLALTMASTQNRGLLKPLQTWYREYFDRIRTEPCGNPMAIVVTLMFDAMFFHHLFGTDVLTEAERSEIIDIARRLAHWKEDEWREALPEAPSVKRRPKTAAKPTKKSVKKVSELMRTEDEPRTNKPQPATELDPSLKTSLFKEMEALLDEKIEAMVALKAQMAKASSTTSGKTPKVSKVTKATKVVKSKKA